MASETTIDHWKVVFSWGKVRKTRFSQNPLNSRFRALGLLIHRDKFNESHSMFLLLVIFFYSLPYHFCLNLLNVFDIGSALCKSAFWSGSGNPQLVVTGAFCLPLLVPNFMQGRGEFEYVQIHKTHNILIKISKLLLWFSCLFYL